MAMDFSALGVGAATIKRLHDAGFLVPTAVQRSCVLKMITGESVTVRAPPGSGKSMAIAIAICGMVKPAKDHLQILVLSARKALALEIQESICSFGDIRSEVVTSSSASASEAHVVIGAPGIIFDQLQRRKLNITKTPVIIIDDLEEMDKHVQNIDRVVSFSTQKLKQVCILGSHNPSSEALVTALGLCNLQFEDIVIDESTCGFLRDHYLVQVISDHQKMKALHNFVDSTAGLAAIIYCNSSKRVSTVVESLAAKNHKVSSIDGSVLPRLREELVDQFRAGSTTYLVSTDIRNSTAKLKAPVVVSYDAPHTRDDFAARVAKVCRGYSLTFAKPSDENLISRLIAPEFTFISR